MRSGKDLDSGSDDAPSFLESLLPSRSLLLQSPTQVSWRGEYARGHARGLKTYLVYSLLNLENGFDSFFFSEVKQIF